MNRFVTLTAAAALMAGVSFASAQTSGTPGQQLPPSDINAGGQTGTGSSQSGSQPAGTVGITRSTQGNNSGTASQQPPPSDLNAGGQTGTAGSKSGSQPEGTRGMTADSKSTITGTAGFCIAGAPGGTNSWKCNYASMEACQKEAQAQDLQCQPNPNMATTGSGMQKR